MKKILFVFLFLSPLIIGQTGRSVLTEKQKDSIRVMIGDSTTVLRSLIGSGGGSGTDSATVSSLISDSLGAYWDSTEVKSYTSSVGGVTSGELNDTANAVRSEIPQPDSISLTFTNTEPAKLRVDSAWLAGRMETVIDSLFDAKITETSLNDLGDVLAETPAVVSVLLYDPNTGFWEAQEYVGGASTGNPDSLGGEPAENYLLKSDSTIYSTQTDLTEGLGEKQDSIDLKLYEDFTQYDADTPESTDLIPFQDVGSGVPKRITYSDFVTGLSIPSISGLASEAYVNQSVDSIRNEIGEADTINLSGGTTGQVLKKASNDDYDFEWADESGGSSDTTHLVSFANVIGLQDTVDALQSSILSGGIRTKSTFDIREMAYVDTFMIYWLDDQITIDSITVIADDSIAFQMRYEHPVEEDFYLFTSPETFLDESSFKAADFDKAIIISESKVYLYFTFIGQSTTRLRMKIYWRYT